jgi:hypothetical protein
MMTLFLTRYLSLHDETGIGQKKDIIDHVLAGALVVMQGVVHTSALTFPSQKLQRPMGQRRGGPLLYHLQETAPTSEILLVHDHRY